jgi:signal peptidase I
MTTALQAPRGASPDAGDPTPAGAQDPARTPQQALLRVLPRVLPTVLAPAGRWALRLGMLLAVLVFAGLAVGPHVAGYRTMTMLTASMAPEIDPGDVVVVSPLPISQVRPGMVISYHIPIDDRRLVTHRVLTVDTSPDGAVTVQTKGDANDAPDPWQATLQGTTAWQVTTVVPDLGHLIQALRTPAISHTLVYGAPALLAGWLLLSIWRPTTTAGQP